VQQFSVMADFDLTSRGDRGYRSSHFCKFLWLSANGWWSLSLHRCYLLTYSNAIVYRWTSC